MRKMVPAAGLALAATLLYAAKLMPPPTKSEPVTDDIHGVKITDPYRWLEDIESPETASWLAAQQELWAAQLTSLPLRAHLTTTSSTG